MRSLVPDAVALALGALGVIMAVAAALIWRRSEEARRRARTAELHADSCLQIVSQALDVAEPRRRSAPGRRVKAGQDWRDSVVAQVERLRAERDASVAPGDPLATLRQVADILARLAGTIAPGALAGRAGEVAGRLSVEPGLSKSVRDLSTMIGSGAPDAIIDLFEAGNLTHVLTTAELLAAYFPADSDLAPLREGYGAAAALLRLDLAERGTTIDLPRFLSVVSASDVSVDRFDRRELRHIPEIAEAANRIGERAGYEAVVVVDCIKLGRRGPGGAIPATIVAWDRASWRPA